MTSLDALITRYSIFNISITKFTNVYLPIIAFLIKQFIASALAIVFIPPVKMFGMCTLAHFSFI